MLETRYRALRIVSLLYKIVAVFSFLGTILATVAVVAGPSVLDDILRALNGVSSSYRYSVSSSPTITLGLIIAASFTFLSGLLISISIYAFANLIDLFIATEENTRVTAMLLQRTAALPMAPSMASMPPMSPMVPMSQPMPPVQPQAWAAQPAVQAPPPMLPSQPPAQYSGWGSQPPNPGQQPQQPPKNY